MRRRSFLIFGFLAGFFLGLNIGVGLCFYNDEMKSVNADWICDNHDLPHRAKSGFEMRKFTRKYECSGWHREKNDD